MTRQRFNKVGSDNLTLAVLDTHIVAAGHPTGTSFHAAPQPFVGWVPSPTGVEVGGRFFPSRNAVLVYACGDAGVEKATLNHELTHALSYATRCKGTAPSHRNGCEYSGQHDAEFYRVLERLHRDTGVKPKDARVPEGDYPRPRRWDDDNAW